ncbi:MAG: histidine kinase [Propionibacteriaceae bacterium]|nr:histidine kinase [Propionibacteriaceae bacterium]
MDLEPDELVSFGHDLLSRVGRILAVLRGIGLVLYLPLGILSLRDSIICVIGLAISLAVLIYWPQITSRPMVYHIMAIVDLAVACSIMYVFHNRGIGMLYLAVTLIFMSFQPSWFVWVLEVLALLVIYAIGLPYEFNQVLSEKIVAAVNFLFQFTCFAVGVGITRMVASFEAELTVVLNFERDKAALAERLELAQDMHDTVTKSLHGCGAYAEGLSRVLAADGHRASGQARDLVGLIRTAETESRQLMTQLNESVYGETSVAEHIQELADEYPHLDIVVPDSELELGDWRTQLVLIRAVRELLENVSRHAKAKTVQIDLAQDGDELVLRVTDDGVGFRIPSPDLLRSQGHFGLHGIRERLTALHGTMSIDSPPQGGTSVEIRVPYRDSLRS